MAFQAAMSNGALFPQLFPPANQGFPQATDFMGSGFSTTTNVPSLPTGQADSPLFPIPTSASPTVVDLITNNTISYHYVTECARRGDKRKRDVPDENIGCPMFVMKKNEHHYPAGAHDAQLQTFDGLNAWLADFGDYETEAELWANWKFIGIVKTEVMRKANYMQHRMFNLAIGLRVSAIAKPWQSDKQRIGPMSKLYFKAVKKDNKWRIEGVVDPFCTKDSNYEGEHLVYAGFAHRAPSIHTNGLNGSWPSEEVFDMFVRG